MKKILSIAAIFIFILGGYKACSGKEEKISGNSLIYICDSPNAYAYHYNINCHGLNRCTHEIIEISQDELNESYSERSLCGFEY